MSRTIVQRGQLLSRGFKPSLPRPQGPSVCLAPAPAIGARLQSSSSSAVPRVAQPSFWKSLVPKFLRKSEYGTERKQKKSKGWNPATYFIVMFLLIGSMSIQMISLKKNFATFMRQSDVRIGLLREVVEKIQKGEKVDVERALGTGDAEKELEWEQVLKEIERDDSVRNQKKRQSSETQSTKASAALEPVQEESDTKSSGLASFF
ncbi:hypothetical protein B0T17DRAFT_616278 [Bombardia bombarda]|uniref:Uncharacterized protein n=1 Tax=Bombardia bombarda TaxID=252184 RepID=A0AA39XB37_9PEZI|nr:hypothetical protein B0T17DRAFT_616278 [Bombardia bombarda]